MEKKISEIVLTPGINNITRVVRIFKAVGGDLLDLAGLMDIPVDVLEHELIAKDGETKPKKKEEPGTYRQFVDVFYQGYLSGTGVKWKFLNKDFVYIKSIISKKLASLQEFQQIMDLYVKIKTDIGAKRKVDFEMANFVKNISPGYIVSKINFLIEKVSAENVPRRKINYEKTAL